MIVEKIWDVTALGELLVDFTPLESRGPNPAFEANPGGAPCNVLAMLSALGRKTAFIGKVGADYFGGMLHSALEELGSSTTGHTTPPWPLSTTTPLGSGAFPFIASRVRTACSAARKSPFP